MQIAPANVVVMFVAYHDTGYADASARRCPRPTRRRGRALGPHRRQASSRALEPGRDPTPSPRYTDADRRRRSRSPPAAPGSSSAAANSAARSAASTPDARTAAVGVGSTGGRAPRRGPAPIDCPAAIVRPHDDRHVPRQAGPGRDAQGRRHHGRRHARAGQDRRGRRRRAPSWRSSGCRPTSAATAAWPA